MNGNDSRPQRESIWTIAAGVASVYFAVFSTLNIMNIVRVIWRETTQASHAGLPALIDAAMDGISGDVPANVALAIAISDIGRVAMVLGALLEQWINKRRERQMNEAISAAVAEATAESRAEGEAHGKASVNALWRAWNERRLDALAKGEPFDEPPPDAAGASENGR